LQTVDADKIAYSRLIMVETPESITTRYKNWEVKAPEWIRHDGIADWFCEKASDVLYWKQGELNYLLGAD
jgi:hypothetical protein